jgi:hypothetical protein
MRNVLAWAARSCLFAIGAAAISWTSMLGPAFWRYASLDGIASQIIRGENSSTELLEAALPVIKSLQQSDVCWPKAMHNAAIIRGRLVQVALENSDPDQFAKGMAAANAMIRKSLSCAPADSFLWFALFWLENMQFGFRDESISYLEKSYELGPYEGWIALKRNGYALIVYKMLPQRLQVRVVQEYAALVNSGFIRETAANLVGAGWPIHETLLAGLSNVREKYKKQLAKDLRRSGVEVNIPGITIPELRPWQVD